MPWGEGGGGRVGVIVVEEATEKKVLSVAAMMQWLFAETALHLWRRILMDEKNGFGQMWDEKEREFWEKGQVF